VILDVPSETALICDMICSLLLEAKPIDWICHFQSLSVNSENVSRSAANVLCTTEFLLLRVDALIE